ncbi:hypothetical protein JT359_17165 [Candidatus Poribacteria bacterium]|nr:hypothetical protein [Candidatus Poribacteria bacterium]
MTLLHKTAGVVILLIALILVGHTIIEPLYYESTKTAPYSSIWETIDIIVSGSLFLCLIYSTYFNVSLRPSASLKHWITAKCWLYGTLFSIVLFLWGWFSVLTEKFIPAQGASGYLLWIFFDAFYPIISGSLSIHILLNANDIKHSMEQDNIDE